MPEEIKFLDVLSDLHFIAIAERDQFQAEVGTPQVIILREKKILIVMTNGTFEFNPETRLIHLIENPSF